MKRINWLITAVGVSGAAMIAVAIISPQTTKRLMSDCEPVILQEECLGYPIGTVLGHVCVSPSLREFMPSDASLGTSDAIQRAGCNFTPKIPALHSGAPSPDEMAAIQKYSDFVCTMKNPDMRAAEIKKALQLYGFQLECKEETL
jgi:hypothetical protein